MLYNLDEICIIPAKTTDIEHRSDVVIYNSHDKLPLFAAPMHCIINLENRKLFEDQGINTIIPRTVIWEERAKYIKLGAWTAVGFEEAASLYYAYDFDKCPKIRICIDQANGHMNKLLELCSKLKDKFEDRIRIMTGNIANPYTYKEYARVGIDYVRVGIGGGGACTTSVQTGIHYPMGSLIFNCYEQKLQVRKEIALGAKYKSVPKIVADGGISRIDQAVKALALGADYVMLGKVFAQADEACGDCESYFSTLENKYVTYREYFGMSTEKAQELINKASLFPVENFQPKHSEGQVQTVKISYSLNDWVSDFEHALRSCMSYTNARNLKEFIGKAQYNTMNVKTLYDYMK
jgi:GMP reductase